MRAPRTKLLALLLALVALVVAGCGGSEVASDEVPGNPPALAVPSDGDIGGGSNADSSGTGTTTGSTGGTAAAAPTTAPSTTDGTSGGTTAPTTTTPSTDDTATNDQAPPAGSDAQQFENFCEQNAGDC